MSKVVLYAEDEFTNRTLLKLNLERLGVEVDVVDNGIAAVLKFKENAYNLVILDRYMPGMDGDAVAVELLNIDPNAKLLAITSDDDEKKALLELGFLDVFIKPLRHDKYIEIVKRYID